jgi:hypothetical protein
MSLSLAVALATAALSAAAEVPARRVAVLEFGASWSVECAEAMPTDPAKREQCEVLRLLADQARAGALAVLRPPEFVVMTRENTAQILKDMGGKCTEGECEVETARLVGASLVLSGGVTILDGTWVVSVKLHDVGSAALLATGSTEATTRLDAFRSVRAERMLRMSLGPEATSASAAAKVAEDRPWRVALELMVGYAMSYFPGVSPQGLEPKSIPVFDGRIHLRIHDAWTLHLGGGAFAATYSQDSSLNNSRITYAPSPKLGVGAAWWPKGNRRFAVSAELGMALTATAIRLTSGGPNYVESTQERQAPFVAAELRYDFPLGGDWYAGGRAGMTWLGTRYDHTRSNSYGTISVKGSYLLLPFSAALGYRF